MSQGTEKNWLQAIGQKDDAAVTTVGVVATIVAYIKGLLNVTAEIPSETNTKTLNSTALASVNTEIDSALNTIVPASPTAGALTDTLSKAAAANTFDKSTDSLEAIRDIIDTYDTAAQADLDAIIVGTVTNATGADVATDVKAVKAETVLIKAETEKIDNAASDGLGGVANSLGYKITEIEKHFHNDEKVFGNVANDMTADTPVKFTVTGGNNAWGTELMLTDGTVIESGSATKKFDLNRLYITSVEAANKISVVQLLYSPINTGVECTFDFEDGAADDIVISAGHGLADGDKVVLKAGGSLPAELNDYTCYYVVGKGTDYFQVALTSGGVHVAFSDDGGAGLWYPIESTVQTAVQTSATKTFVSAAAVNADALPLTIMMPRITCNQRLFIRALSETGQTVSIGFLIGLHTYDES